MNDNFNINFGTIHHNDLQASLYLTFDNKYLVIISNNQNNILEKHYFHRRKDAEKCMEKIKMFQSKL
jgi:hypothetical protein